MARENHRRAAADASTDTSADATPVENINYLLTGCGGSRIIMHAVA
jgi:hypothetical protein